MPIDITERDSPGWWMNRLARKLERRGKRLERLDSYYRGDPPLPPGAENARRAYRAFQRQARLNMAELTVEAVLDRMKLVGFRTAAGGDENGDAEAAAIAKANSLDVESAEVHRTFLSLGDAYAIVGDVDDETEQPVITAEDPRQVVTAHDPVNQRRIRAGLKIYADDDYDEARAYLYLPGRTFVAHKEGLGGNRQAVRFNAASWDWHPDLGGADGQQLPFDRVPVVRFRNRRGIGEYEHHTDVLDRINFMILQRMVIAIFQAFRQRALKGALPKTDPETGAEIDYDALFSADPGALWQLPDGIDLWESAQADLGGILNAVKDDVLHLAAVTRTPLHMFSPDAAAGSAEGASLQREGLVFKAEDRVARAAPGWSDVMSLAFLWKRDTERATPAGMEPMWAPVERYSLAERYDAAVKAKAADEPWRSIMTDVLQKTPDQVRRMEAERLDDVLLSPALPTEPTRSTLTTTPAAPQTGQPTAGEQAPAVNGQAAGA